MIDQEVASRVQEFKGKPQALQQQYAASQQLIDLLALQKIKSMQETAAREMQMQMAQQQAANGESNSTIADQREKEVMDMTKQELAQQRGDLAKQQEREQQEAMQRLMGGIASAPGAANAMEPKAMYAGGIVAFQSGNQVKDPEQKSDDDLRKKYEREATEMSFGTRMQFSSPEVKQMGDRIQAENQAAYLKREQSRMLQPVARPSATGDMPPTPQAPAPAMGADAETQKLARLSANPLAAQNINPALRPTAPMAPPPPQAGPQPPAPPAPPKPQQQQGLGGLQMGPPEDTLGNALTRESVAAMKIDPRARQLEEEKRVEERLKLTPAQRGVYDEGIAGLKKFYDQDFDPETQRREGIKRYLLGMGGRSQGEFAGGAGAAMDYDTAQKNQQRARFGEMQKAREGIIGLEREPVKSGIEGGYKAYEQGEKTKQIGLTSGANVYQTETQSKDNAAKNEIEKLRFGAQNAATAAQRDANDFSKLSGHLSTITYNRAKAEQAVVKSFQKEAQAIEMQLMANPKDKEALGKKAALQLEIESNIDKTTKPFDLLASSIEAKLYGGKQGGLGGFTVREKPTK
jgi:hypothetical protein